MRKIYDIPLVKKMRRYGVRSMAFFLKAGRNWNIIL